MAGQPAAPQLAISVLAACLGAQKPKKRWPAAQNLYIPLCIFLAVEGL
jgi:hypothetical protein